MNTETDVMRDDCLNERTCTVRQRTVCLGLPRVPSNLVRGAFCSRCLANRKGCVEWIFGLVAFAIFLLARWTPTMAARRSQFLRVESTTLQALIREDVTIRRA